MFKKTLLICSIAYFLISGFYVYWINKQSLTYRNYAMEINSNLNFQLPISNFQSYAPGQLIVKFKQDIIKPEISNQLSAMIRNQKLDILANFVNKSYSLTNPSIDGLLSFKQDTIPVYDKFKDKVPSKYVAVRKIVYSPAAIDNVNSVNLVNLLTTYKVQSLELLFEKDAVSDKLENVYLIKFPSKTDLKLILTDLSELQIVDYAEQNFKIELFYQPNDQYYQ